MKFYQTDLGQMDSRLQFLLTQHNTMDAKLSFASAAEGYMPVMARVSNIEQWRNLGEVQQGIEIPVGPNEDKEEEYIVTARVPISRLEYLDSLTYVEVLRAPTPIKRALHATLEDFQLADKTSVIGTVAVDDLLKNSQDVIVGIVDYGCDFAHQSFQNSDGSTRLSWIWNQGGTSNRFSPNGYGRVYTRDQINQALRQTQIHPYLALGYNPGEGAHGTHVMDIAAGSGSKVSENKSNSPGVAPHTELVFVELDAENPGTIKAVVDTSFADSVRLLEAVKYIFDYAGKVGKPCVVNLSLGTNGGPHDGSTLVEKGLDALVTAQPNRAVVIAASNSYADKIHSSGTVNRGSYTEIEWDVPKRDKTPNEIEIWYEGDDEFKFELIDQSGNSVAIIPLGKNGYVTKDVDGQEKLLCYISHRKRDPSNKDNAIHIFESPRYQGIVSQWKLRLHGVKISAGGGFHAWAERDDAGQSNFKNNVYSYTLGSISCGEKSIVVGAYDAHPNEQGVRSFPISFFSSAGPTRDGRKKPEVSAPGYEVLAAKSGSRNGVIKMSGTSMATPAVTGFVALMFGLAKSRNISLTIDQTLQILTETAAKASSNDDDVDERGWDSRYGYGRVSARAFSHRFFTNQAITAVDSAAVPNNIVTLTTVERAALEVSSSASASSSSASTTVATTTTIEATTTTSVSSTATSTTPALEMTK